MSKISGTTLDVIARIKLVLHSHSAVSHLQREAPQSDGDTGGVSATGTLMLKQAHRRYRSNRPTPRVHGLVSGDARGVLMPALAGVAPV
ncbi:hypothetical protein TIFTF001_015962 [Ficus carica]|uniref:Uncharacterized protein n=1 Tax=Ficus carica TaxID=3494 RepID=A0AA88A5F4_FICCA|nr:hypothetical protein TIFTF001_015962 [Ficus carica]